MGISGNDAQIFNGTTEATDASKFARENNNNIDAFMQSAGASEFNKSKASKP